MTRRYLRKLARRCAPVTVRPDAPAIVDPVAVVVGLALAAVLVLWGMP